MPEIIIGNLEDNKREMREDVEAAQQWVDRAAQEARRTNIAPPGRPISGWTHNHQWEDGQHIYENPWCSCSEGQQTTKVVTYLPPGEVPDISHACSCPTGATITNPEQPRPIDWLAERYCDGCRMLLLPDDGSECPSCATLTTVRAQNRAQYAPVPPARRSPYLTTQRAGMLALDCIVLVFVFSLLHLLPLSAWQYVLCLVLPIAILNAVMLVWWLSKQHQRSLYERIKEQEVRVEAAAIYSQKVQAARARKRIERESRITRNKGCG